MNNDFLGNLVQRSLAATGAVRPQLLSIFEPPSVNDRVFFPRSEAPEPFGAPSRSRWKEQDAAVAPAGQVVAPSSNPALDVSEFPSPRRPVEQVRPRVEFPGEEQAVAASTPGSHEPASLRFELPNTPQRVRPHLDLPAKNRQTAESDKTDNGTHPLPTGEARPAKRAGPGTDLSGVQPAEMPSRRASEIRPRVDSFETPPSGTRSGARPKGAEIAKRNGEGAAAPGERLLSEQANGLKPPHRSATASHDPGKNRSSVLRADKMISIMDRARAADGPMTSARDVHAVSPRPLPPRSPAFPPQSKDPPVAPSINVTIGRIEVRAMPPATVVSSKAARPPAPLMNLDEYLRRRAGGNGR
jgi:hypothetical protein